MDPSIVPIVAKEAKEVSKPLSGAIAGTLAEFWHTIVGDKVVAWRLKNAAKVSEKLEEEISARGLALRTDALPESYAYRWFEKASEEDEPELQALFAKLLANAANGNEAALQRQNIDLVSRMSPDAAQLLIQIVKRYHEARERFKDGDFNLKDITTEVAFANYEIESHFELATTILISLGILRISVELFDLTSIYYTSRKSSLSRKSSIHDTAGLSESFALTVLGANLIEALFPPTADQS